MRRNYHRKLWGEIITGKIWGKIITEGGREECRERVREIEGNRERDGEWEKEKYNSWGSINGLSIRRRVGLTLKLDELLGPSMTFEVILI